MRTLAERTEVVEVSASELNSDSGFGSKSAQPHKSGQPSKRMKPPASSRQRSSIVDVAYEEFCRRRDAGESVDPDDFCALYPRVQSSLARLLEAHRFLEENPSLLEEAGPRIWPESGEEFAGFSLLGELGQGAFARVFQAREPALGDRLVAVKISPETSTEAAIVGRLNHPHIVPVYSVREEPLTGLSVVCMPYLGSATLTQVLDRIRAEGKKQGEAKAAIILEAVREPGSKTAAPAAPILARGTLVDGVRWLGLRLAEALAFIHGRGICHRDLKPSNVLVKPDGTPMLLDFNLSSDVLLPDTKLGGTPLYMAPEHLQALDHRKGTPIKKPDGRSDLYSVGVILYELLTGTHPFGPIPLKLSSVDMRRHLLEQQGKGFRPIRELNPAVDSTLACAVEACLARDMEERPASAAQLVQWLQKGFAPVRRLGRWIVRHPKTVAAASFLLFGLSAAGAFHVATQDPAHVREFKQAGEAYGQGHYQQAIFHLDQVLKLDKDSAEARWLRGRAYQKLGPEDRENFVRALQDFQALNALAPSGKALAAAGYCWQLLGKNDMAMFYYDKAKAEKLVSAEMANNVGYLMWQRASFEEARDNLEESLRLNPKSLTAHYNLALVYLNTAVRAKQQEVALSELESGIGHVRRAMEIGPTTTDLALDAARLCSLAARYDQQWSQAAIDYLRQAMGLALDPVHARQGASSTFRAIKDRPQFADICNSQQVGMATASVRILDPFRD